MHSDMLTCTASTLVYSLGFNSLLQQLEQTDGAHCADTDIVECQALAGA